MRSVKRPLSYLIALTLISSSLFMSGCWNYREVNQFATVAGLAIDKKGSKYIISVEIYNVASAQGQLTLKPVIYSGEGVTEFDAVRSMIIKVGRKLYWSHAKVVIIGKNIAKKSVLTVIDWLSRDAEIRSDMWVFVSREKTAREIFKAKVELNDILSYQLNQTMRNEKFVSEAPTVDLWRFISDLSSKGSSGIMPAISIKKSAKRKDVLVGGTAIFKKDRLIGFLNKEETKNLLFVKNEVHGGILPFKMPYGHKDRISLEIGTNKTEYKPVYKNGTLTMKIHIKTTVDIGEIQGNTDYTSQPGMVKLKKYTQKKMAREIEKLIRKVQSSYKSDILGFSNIVLLKMPQLRKRIGTKWDSFFAAIKPKVKVSFDITGTAKTVKPIKVSN